MTDGEMDHNDTLQHLVDSLNLEHPSDRPASWATASTLVGSEAAGAASRSVTSNSPATRNTPPSFQRASPTSLFSSGTPTHTLNVARSTPILTSSPSGSIRRLSAMSSSAEPSSSAARRSTRFANDAHPRIPNNRSVATAQKDGDDPSTPIETTRYSGSYHTPTTLTRLMAAEMMPTSPDNSRHPSYNSGGLTALSRPHPSDASTLPEHLYTRGFLGGRHSDITIIAFGQRYPLHRLILDRAPFFMNGLSEPWVESSQREVPLHPEEMDHNITRTSFELALKKLYGVDISAEEDAEAVGLFATGCWLEMQDLIDGAIESILRQMAPDNLATLIKLVTNNYYGKAGERILASARAMLCRDGSEMPLKYWDHIPAEVVRETVGGDGFYINGEWERWYLARRILDKRLKHKAVEVGLSDQYAKFRPQAPSDPWLETVRSDSAYRQEFAKGLLDIPESVQRWCMLYTHPEVEPIVALLQEGVHYAHLEFEQLMFIRESRDFFNQPVVPDKLIMEAQWQQLELRSKVLGARDNELELGLSLALEQHGEVPDENRVPVQDVRPPQHSRASPIKGKGKAPDNPEDVISPTRIPHSVTSVPVHRTSEPDDDKKKFYIPSQDCNIVMGGNSDPVITASTTVQRSAPGDTTEPSIDVSTSPPSSDRPVTPGGTPTSTTVPRPESYSTFPPFRFSAEFPNPRQLKERKRVYSRTVFYAGSLWNVYIQKVRSARNPQLGVYLHRAKEREAEEGVISGIGAAGQPSYLMSGGHVVGAYGGRTDSIDEQIGRLEREMLLRGERREHNRALRAARHRSVQSQPVDLGVTRANGADDTSGSNDETQTVPPSASTSTRLASYGRQRIRRNPATDDTVRTSLQQRWAFPLDTDSESSSSSGTDDDDSPDEDDMFNAFTTIPPSTLSPTSTPLASTSPTAQRRPRKLIVRSSTGQTATPGPAAIARDQRDRDAQARRPGITRSPTLPPYVDARPTIRTWFKIYSPSRGGRLLSVYESAPDQFNFSQSWGWKSGSLMLDEGFGPAGGSGDAAGSLGSAAEMGISVGEEKLGETLDDGKRASGKGKKVWRPKGEGKLRFMVVIGNL